MPNNKPNKPTPPKFETKYVVDDEGVKTELNTKAKFNAYVKKHGEDLNFISKEEFELTTLTLKDDEVPKLEFDEENLPPVVNVRNKKTQQTYSVNRKHFLQYRHELELN